MRRELEVAAVVDRDSAPSAARSPVGDEIAKAILEQVVARDDEQVVVDPAALDGQLEVSDRTEPVFVGERAVIVDDHAGRPRPAAELVGKAAVRDQMDLVHFGDLASVLENPVDDRPAADGQQRLRDRVGERPEASRIPAGEDDHLHLAATAPASESRYGERCTPASVTIASIRSPGRHVEGRIASRETDRDLRRVAFLDRDSRAVGSVEVDGRAGRDDVERDVVVACEHCERVRTDLVGSVAVGRDAVGARDHTVDFARRHERGGCRVGDDGVRDARGLELPRRQAGALQERPRLVHPDMLKQTAFPGREQGADGAAVAARRKTARVAMSECASPGASSSAVCAAIRRQRSTSSAWKTSSVLVRRVVTHRVESPGEIDGSRPRRSQDTICGREILAVGCREGNPVRGCDTDRRRSAHDHRLDRSPRPRLPSGTRSRSRRAAGAAGRGRPPRPPRAGGFAQARARWCPSSASVDRSRPVAAASDAAATPANTCSGATCPRPTMRGTSPAPA